MPLIAPGDLIVGSWIHFRKNIRVYAEFATWFALLGILRWVISSFTNAYVDDTGTRILINQILKLPLYFLYVVLSVAVVQTVAEQLGGKTTDIRAALADGMHKAFPSIWVGILSTAGVITGFIFFVIPGIIWSLKWKFAQNFVILDGMRGTAAIKASANLVEGRWWATLGRVLAPAIFFYAGAAFVTSLTYLLLGSVLGDPGLFFGQFSATQVLPKTHDIITNIVPEIVSALALPLYVGAELLLWNDLKKTG